MTPIGSVASAYNALPLKGIDMPTVQPATTGLSTQSTAPTQGFSNMLEGLVQSVSDKQANAQQVTQQVLLGDSPQLHQSVIAMQEASVSFSLMVEVRNKLVDSYQELMRMQV
jgi:flagellar hook-basal body complex protein FliE